MFSSGLALLCFCLLLAPAPHRHSLHPSHRRAVHAPRRPRGSGISAQRATAIQQALVAAGYLSKVTGHWDAASAEAMKRYQSDHHWQTRFVPDARALIALGLGPGQDTPAPATAAGTPPAPPATTAEDQPEPLTTSAHEVR